MSCGCERSCSSHPRVSNFNSKVPRGVSECSRRQGLRAEADAAAMLKP